MKTPALLLSVIAAALPIAAAHPRESIGSATALVQDDSARKIKDLQKERIDTLRALVEVTAKLYQGARAEVHEPLDARLALLGAEVDAAEKPTDRIKLYEAAIASIMELEKIAKSHFEAGRGNQAAGMKLKARRLEIQINLERAKAAK